MAGGVSHRTSTRVAVSTPTRFDVDRGRLGELLDGESRYRVDQVWQGLYERLATVPEMAWPGLDLSKDARRILYSRLGRHDSNILLLSLRPAGG